MRAISEEKRDFRKKIITILGLIVSLIGGIITVIIGYMYYESNFWGMTRESIGIPSLVIGVISIVGVVISIKLKKVGSLICILVGIPGFFYLVMGLLLLGIPIIIILIGGIVGLSAENLSVNYENLKAWKEQNFPSKHKREAGWEKKLILPGVIFLILGGILIFLSFFYLLPWQIANGVETNVSMLFYPAMIFMIIGPVLIIYSVIKLRK